MAGSLVGGAGRRLWGWVPPACRSFSLGVPGLLHVRLTVPPPRVVDRWNEKRAMFGVYDNIGILGMIPCSIVRGNIYVAIYVVLGTVLSALHVLFNLHDKLLTGNFEKHPKELIKGPRWLRGWKGNELQRCIRKKKMVGNRMFVDDLHNLNKRISYLYKHFNRHGKYR